MQPYFDAIIILIICLNTFSLALDIYPRPDDWVMDMLTFLNFVFTIVFTIEAALKIIGLGPRAFVRDKTNQFDFAIVIISLVELIRGGGSESNFLSGFRAFRLMKIFRLFKSGDLRILLDSIQFTLTTIQDYTILLGLFIYVCALMGMSFFAGNINFKIGEDTVVFAKKDVDGIPGLEDIAVGEPPREHFDDPGQAIITIFLVLFGEGWNDIMYNTMRCSKNSVMIALYYIMLVICGNIIMLNLFLAILLGNFDKARNFGVKKKVFAAFQELIGDGRSLNDTLDLILGDMSQHVKEKVLLYDKKQLKKLKEQGDTKIGEGLMEDNFKFMSENNQTQLPGLMDKPIKKSFIDSEGQVSLKMTSSPEKPEVPRQISSISATLKHINSISMSPSPSPQEKQEIGTPTSKKKSNEAIQRKKSLLSQNSMKKNVQFSKAITKVHHENPKIKRLREFNRQQQLKPYKGLKEILRKQELNTLSSISISSSELSSNSQSEKENDKKEQNEEKISDLKDEKRDNSFKLNKKKQKRSKSQITDDKKGNDLFAEERTKKDKGKDVNIVVPRSVSERSGISADILSKKSDSTIHLVQGMSKKDFFKSRRQSIGFSNNNQQTVDAEVEENLGDINEDEEQLPLRQRIFDYISNSSVFLFNRHSKIRLFCLMFAETEEVLNDLKKREQSEGDENYVNDGESVNSYPATVINDSQKGATYSKGPEEVSGGASIVGKKSIIANKMLDKNKKAKTQPSKVFEDIILVLIILSSLQLAIDNPLGDPKGFFKNYVLRYIEYVFTILFTVEAAIKIIAKGLMFNKMYPVQPYLRSTWNILDAFVVTASLIDFVSNLMGLNVQGMKSLKALRAFRAFRPLRVISKDEGMKLVVNALLASFPSMYNVVLVCSLFLLIFSLIGCALFKGGFQNCQPIPGTELTIPLERIIDKTDCIEAGGYMHEADQNFNNCLLSMLTFFQMMTTEGWVNVAYNGIDCVGEEKQPQEQNNPLMMVFFIAYMIVGSQFIINLFVGVVIDNFNTIKEKEELGNMFVTEQQRSWIEIQKVGQGKKLRVKINEPVGIQKTFYDLVNHTAFEYTIIVFIILNTALMGIKHYLMPEIIVTISEQANYVFAAVFNVEMVLKLLGLKKVYFYSIILNVTKISEGGGLFSQATTIIRALRIMRMFKLIRASVHFRVILETLFNILPQIVNVMTLIVLLFFIYALLGLQLFSSVMLKDTLDQKNNFQSFPRAMVVLMRYATGEDWNVFMYELAQQDYNGIKCESQQTYEEQQIEILGCGSPVSFIYFLSFTVLVSMLIMNLTVAAVIEGLDTAKKENMGVVQGDDIEMLIDYWQFYDPEARGWIKLTDLVFLLYELPAPLGKKTNKMIIDQYDADPDNNDKGVRQQDRYLVNYEKKIVMKKIDALELLRGLKIKVHQDPNKQIHFVDVLKALIKRVLTDKKIDYKLSVNLNKKIKNQWEKKHKAYYLKDFVYSLDGSKYTCRHQHAGVIITKWAKKSQNLQKNNYKKTEKKNKSSHHKGGNQKQNKETTGQEIQQQRQEELGRQAKAIFKIIKQEKTEESGFEDQQDNEYRVKNNYFWKDIGGDKLFNQRDPDKSDDDFDSELHFVDSFEDGPATNKKESPNVSSPKKDPQQSNQLFGPEAISILEKYGENGHEDNKKPNLRKKSSKATKGKSTIMQIEKNTNIFAYESAQLTEPKSQQLKKQQLDSIASYNDQSIEEESISNIANKDQPQVEKINDVQTDNEGDKKSELSANIEQYQKFTDELNDQNANKTNLL